MFKVDNLQLNVYLSCMKVETNNLMSVKNYAVREGVTSSYIYKLEKQERMNLLSIDGVKFVDITKYPTIPVKNRR